MKWCCVQRKSAYAGYGAFNAPFHIASQKRALNLDNQFAIGAL